MAGVKKTSGNFYIDIYKKTVVKKELICYNKKYKEILYVLYLCFRNIDFRINIYAYQKIQQWI